MLLYLLAHAFVHMIHACVLCGPGQQLPMLEVTRDAAVAEGKSCMTTTPPGAVAALAMAGRCPRAAAASALAALMTLSSHGKRPARRGPPQMVSKLRCASCQRYSLHCLLASKLCVWLQPGCCTAIDLGRLGDVSLSGLVLSTCWYTLVSGKVLPAGRRFTACTLLQGSNDDCLHLLEEAADAQGSAPHDHISQNLLASLFGESLSVTDGAPAAAATEDDNVVGPPGLAGNSNGSVRADSSDEHIHPGRNGVHDGSLSASSAVLRDGQQRGSTRNGSCHGSNALSIHDGHRCSQEHRSLRDGAIGRNGSNCIDGTVARNGSTALFDGMQGDDSRSLRNGCSTASISGIWAHNGDWPDGSVLQHGWQRSSSEAPTQFHQAGKHDVSADPIVAIGTLSKHSQCAEQHLPAAEYSIWASQNALPMALLPELAMGREADEGQAAGQAAGQGAVHSAGGHTSRSGLSLAVPDGALPRDTPAQSRTHSELGQSTAEAPGDSARSQGAPPVLAAGGAEAAVGGTRGSGGEQVLVSEADAMLMLRKLLSRTFNAGGHSSEQAAQEQQAAPLTVPAAPGPRFHAMPHDRQLPHSSSASGAAVHAMGSTSSLPEVKAADGRPALNGAIPHLQLTQQQLQALTMLVQGRPELSGAAPAAPAAAQSNDGCASTTAGTSEAAVTNTLARLFAVQDGQRTTTTHGAAQGFTPAQQQVSAALGAALQRIAASAQAGRQAWPDQGDKGHAPQYSGVPHAAASSTAPRPAAMYHTPRNGHTAYPCGSGPRPAITQDGYGAGHGAHSAAPAAADSHQLANYQVPIPACLALAWTGMLLLDHTFLVCSHIGSKTR